MTEKGCDNCYYTYFDEKAYPCSLCIRGIERTDQWQPSKKTKADRKTESSSEKPNNCEHITEDGVTCAKYPACDDCLDNPLNKVKGSERLVKGSEQTEPTISKMEQVDEPERNMAEDIVESFGFKAESYRQAKAKDEPQIGEMMTEEEFDSMLARVLAGNNEPQTERSE